MNLNKIMLNKYLRIGSNEEKTIKEIYSYKENSFNIVRLILAILVIYSHLFPIFLGEGSSGDLLQRATHGQISFGDLSVYGFFVISGFLITQSMLNSSSYLQYFFKRVLRIFPAFFVSLFMCGFIIGPIVSSLSLREYLYNRNILQVLEFIFKNLTLNIFGYKWGFLDVFENNIYPMSVNGSMWTLKHEFVCYLILILLSFFYALKEKRVLIGITKVCLLLSILNIMFNYKLFELGEKAWVISAGEYSSFIIFVCYFLQGVLMYVCMDKIKINLRYILLAVILILFANKIQLLKVVMIFVLPYLTIAICVSTNIKSITKYGDFSYGMYIYAFPIQQILSYYFKNSISAFAYCIISIAITFIISVLSWRFIEKPMLDLKNKFINKESGRKFKQYI